MLKTNFIEPISKLGLGAMRLPSNKDGIDYEELNKMVDIALESGINYFDTAYVYHNGLSEVALRKSLVERHDRSKFLLADKLSIWVAKDKNDLQRVFDTQLERAGVDYFDYYLIHSLDKARYKQVKDFGGFEFVQKLKEEGKAKHIGFSFHDSPELLEEILKNHPEMEFVQLQINYLDWDIIRSKECYEVARKYNKPIIIMEPVKGGTLAVLPDDIEKILKDVTPDKSIVSWAFRFLIEKEGIMSVLSGMSNCEQLEDNIKTFSVHEPLTVEENKALDEAIINFKKLSTIPCTGCEYCIDCPKKINIPSVFGAYNQYKRNPDNAWNAVMMYQTNLDIKADVCIECGKCESHCPQAIEIIKELKVCHKALS